MKMHGGIVALLAVAALVGCGHVAWATPSNGWVLTLMVDDFSDNQLGLAGNSSSYNSVNGTMVGGNRDQIFVYGLSKDTDEEHVSNGHWVGDGSGEGSFAMQYDGADETETLDTKGLGSVDFTIDSGIALELMIYVTWGSHVSAQVFTNGGSKSCNITVELTDNINDSFPYYMPFSEMPSCDFTQVSALQITYPFPIDMRTDYVGVVRNGSIPTPTPTPTATPSPSPTFVPSSTPTRTYMLPTVGPTQTLEFGIPVTVSVSTTVEARFQTQQIDASSVSSISFVGDTESQASASIHSGDGGSISLGSGHMFSR